MVPISFLLNVIHGFFSLIYYGAILIFGVVVAPKFSKLSEGTISELMSNVFPTLLSFIEASGMITIVFGAGEFFHYMIGYYKDGGLSEVGNILFSTGWGICVFSGAILGFIGFSIGLIIASNFEKIFKLYKSTNPESINQIQLLQIRLKFYSLLGAIFLTTTVILMILAVSFLPLPN
ncbi:hypothetical protein DFR86_01325 [Acidianus sulfidivorans JP7]|uniref:DUF4149 domain-containing protein n=1 Tax=Acidianus sulfidivorans JP7 TaxID=619593 RepID=A0A2U9IJU8_9CREN|nr:hypothetical protein [Acidianus sulfidivorans]AWR96317.1 hypothetical protein DFR86_01325 [Acidianus sulfidivorans JP7]